MADVLGSISVDIKLPLLRIIYRHLLDQRCRYGLKSKKKELERQYSPSMWSKRYSPDIVIEVHISTATKASEEAKSEIPVDLGVPYGIQEGEKMDIFGGDTLPKDAPILVYIHGGYWQSLERTISSYVVKPLYNCGIRSIVVGYDLAPKVRMGEMIKQIQKAAKYILNMALKLGSKKVWFAGHSAGAHLCCMLLLNDWLDSLNLEEKALLKGLVLISGVFDLTPLLPTYVNEPLGMTREDAASFSPMYFEKDKIAEDIRVLVALGENDSPEFQRQSKDFHNKLLERAIHSEYVLIPQVDHFDIVEKLNDCTQGGSTEFFSAWATVAAWVAVEAQTLAPVLRLTAKGQWHCANRE